MALFGGLIRGLRNDADQIGSFFTGQPAHGSAPSPASPQPAPQAPQPQFHPLQVSPNPIQQPTLNGTPNIVSQPHPLQISQPQAPRLSLNQPNPLMHNPLTVQTAHPAPISNAPPALPTGIAGRPDNGPQINQILHPDLLQQVGTGLQQKLQVPMAAASETHDLAQQFISRPIVQVGLSLTNQQKTFQPTGEIQRAVLGSTPIQNIQKGVASTYDNHPSLPIPLRTGLAAGYGVGQVLQDAPVVGKIAELAGKGGIALHDAIQSLGDANRTNLLKTATQNAPVQNLPIKSLTSYEGAPDRAKVDQYKAQIQSGQPTDPLIALQDSKGNLGIEDGKHRLQAYQELGYKSVPVRVTTPDELSKITQGGYGKIPGASENVPQPGNVPTDSNTSSLNESVDQKPIGQNDSLPNNIPHSPSKGFILKEGPIRGGKQDVIRIKRNPDTGHMEPSVESITAPKALDANAYANTFGTSKNEANKVIGNMKQTDAKVGKPFGKKQANIPRSINPIDVKLSEPEAGDYGSAITDKQRAESAIGTAARVAKGSVSKLSNSDRELFSYARENPELIGRAENPQQLRKAIDDFGRLTDTANAYDVAAGGKTPHISNYYRHVIDLSKPEDQARFDQLVQDRGNYDPFSYNGLNNQPRVFKNISEAEAAKFKVLNKDPLQEIEDYTNKAKYVVGNQALARTAQLADARRPDAVLSESLKLAPGKHVSISPEAAEALKGVVPLHPSQKLPFKIARTANQAVKSTILSAGQFHTINIGALRAAPTLIARGHPLAAAKGMYGMFRSAFGEDYANRVIGNAIKDGTVDKAAKIGMPYGADGYNVAGTFLKSGVGNNLVFGKQIPMMHDQVARSIISDLEKHNVDLDSPEARQAGLAGAHLMGELNKELENISPQLRQAISDYMLAGQFTPSKFLQVKTAFSPSAYKGAGIAGKYASASVAANVAASFLVIAGLGYAFKQKSDNLRDMLLRALVDPAVPTPLKDNKGNTIKLRIPATDTADIAKLLGMKLVRNSDGHLGISWNIQNLPSTLQDFARARLAPVPSALVKIKTNSTFAGKPLFDPTAPLGTKAIQAGTSLAIGDLPIGTQGIPYTNFVKSHAPNSVKEVLDAQTPGTNPVVKSVGSSFGLTPTTDMTVGKGQQTAQYYDALNAATKGLNANDKAAFNAIHQQTKNPVTGQYVIQPTVFDTPAKAELYLQHPNVLAADTKLNQKLASEGQKVDPFYTELNPAQQQAALVRNTINKNNTQQLTAWDQQNPWYGQFSQDRAAFYNSLPPGDPNKPKNPIQPPAQTADVQNLFNQYDQLSDPVQKAQFFGAHPELSNYESQQADYTNAVLKAQGLTPLKKFPTPDADTSAYTSAYMNGSKAQRAALKSGNPQGYLKMEAYLQNVSEYQVAKNGALDQLQGQTPNQKLLKGINSLATYDMVKNPDGTLALKYGSVNPGAPTYGSVAAQPQAGAVSTSGAGGYGKSYHKKSPKFYFKRPKRIKVKHAHKPHIFLKPPPSSIKIRNKVNQHPGIHRKTYL